MRLKSFHGHTLNEAMRKVREALGEDAIIVATRDDEMGGIRVTAALEDAPPSLNQAVKPAPEVEQKPPPDVIETIADALYRHSVPALLSERLLAAASTHVSHDPVLSLGAAIDHVFDFAEPVKGIGSPIILIGPPGAGKTLTAAKLVTRNKMQNIPTCVISTDTLRAAGMEELKAFTRLLSVTLLEVEDAGALRDAVHAHPAQQIIIDTAGRNPFDLEDMKELAPFVKAAGSEPVLVLPAGLDAQEAGDMAKAYAALGARRMILTRLDLTRRLGSALATIFAAGLALLEASASPKVADGLEPLDPIQIARRLLPAELSNETGNVQASTKPTPKRSHG